MRGGNHRADVDSSGECPGRGDTGRLSALCIAAQKHGGQVLRTGGAEFQERVACMCATMNIHVVNPDLAVIVRDAQPQLYCHRAWALASQCVREECERERQGVAGRERRAVEGR